MLELNPDEFDLKGCFSTGMKSDWEKSWENEILGLMDDIPQFSEQSSTTISFKFNLFDKTRAKQKVKTTPTKILNRGSSPEKGLFCVFWLKRGEKLTKVQKVGSKIEVE